jgi:hypothetical protein
MPYTRLQIAQHAERIGRSARTLRRWVAQGCDLEDPGSVQRFLAQAERKKTNIQRSRERLGKEFLHPSDGKQKAERQVKPQPWGKHKGNDETPPPVVGKDGAAAALECLERQEETAYRRLQVALEGGDRFQVQAAQDFWLKCSETLRRLDLAVEVARRSEETQIPLRQAESVVLAVADWLRIAFMQFLSAEVRALMGIKDIGEWKFYAFGRFKGILDLTVAGSLKSRSPIPDWAEPFVRLRLSSKSSLKTVRARHSV